MQNKSNSQSIIFNGEEFLKINKFDCRVVDLERPGGGTTFTVLPVSTHSKVVVKMDGIHTTFFVTDDWGKVHTMVIPNFMNEEIKAAKEGAENVAREVSRAHR